MENFQLGDRIGSGAFGSVYKVIRKEDSKIYAMKRVKITQLGTKEKENALNEIRILASFNHPNIIGYKEAFYDDNSQTLNIVMEYADDGDIESKISNNKLNKLSFQESTIWNILIQILQGLKFLHDNNIIHRDLKSANIFLMKNGLIKIGDLNVSKLSKIGSANTHTGTPYYSSPEIWTEQSYNNKTDIWSVGCIIYEMCNLLPPFRGTSLINLFNNIQKGVYKPVNKMYSKDLCKVISKMLIVDPEKRPSCDQLLSLNVIRSKMNDIKKINGNENEIYKVDLIQTIKFPKKLNDINKILPHKKMYNVENEMMMNDEFETKKAGFFKEVNKEINKDNNNNNKGNNHINKQNNLINNPAKNNLNIKRPSSSFQSKNKEQKKIVISHSNSHKNPHNNYRYQNYIYNSYNSNIDNKNDNNQHNNNQHNNIQNDNNQHNNIQNDNNQYNNNQQNNIQHKNIQHNNIHHNNIHHNNSNQNYINNNNNFNNYIQINNIQQHNNKVRPSSGRKVPNNLVNNRPNNNLIKIHEYHSDKLKQNVKKLQMENKKNKKKKT